MPKYTRTSTPDRASQKQATGRINKYFGMFIGIVKENADSHRMGRLKVWVPELGSDPKDESGWITASYCSPFAGVTDSTYVGKGNDKVTEFAYGQQSYGMWFVPPDINNQIAVMFANGDPARAFWFGSIYNQYMNQMVPAIAAGRNYEFDDVVPTTEYNKHEIRTVDPNDATRPYHQYHTEGLVKQGLIRDQIRGVSNSSARREAPSQVYGWNTPGPVNPERRGHRKGGSQMVYDDLEGNEHIAFKTRSGAGIRIDESNGIVYITNRNGTGWVEISENGQIQLYGKGDVSVRSEGDLNFRADRDLNLEAGRDIHMKAVQSYKAPSDPLLSSEILGDDKGEGGNIKIQALSDVDLTVQTNFRMNVLDENYDLKVKGNMTTNVSGNVEHTTSGHFQHKSGSHTTIQSTNANLDSGGNLAITGGLKTGAGIQSGGDVSTSGGNSLDVHEHNYIDTITVKHGNVATTKTSLSHTGGSVSISSSPPTPPVAATSKLPPVYDKTNVFYDNDVLTFDKKTQSITTIVTKFMSAEPCRDHENHGGQSF